jgi:hypothetical protein
LIDGRLVFVSGGPGAPGLQTERRSGVGMIDIDFLS